MSAPVLGFAAYSGTGKTTLLERLIPLLKSRGLRVAVLKHAHHEFDIDKPGKDSYRLRKAGADQMLIASDKRWALMTETPRPASFESLLAQFDQRDLDLIIVEGFKGESIPKIELHRASLGHELICQQSELFTGQNFSDNACGQAGKEEGRGLLPVMAGGFIAVASDTELSLPTGVSALNINQIDSIADFIQFSFLQASANSSQ